MSKFRIIPSIDELRKRDAMQLLETRYGQQALVSALRDETEALRQGLADGTTVLDGAEAAAVHIEAGVGVRLEQALQPSLRGVINATGVIVHTNLGRAPLAAAAIERIAAVATGYCNLEYDLTAGTRGRRDTHASALLKRLTHAEAAAVVNNNAAGLFLILTALASGREVIISRGELVEIGGGFRIPDVMRASGARLREVGTTNRTRAADYAAAISDETGLILRVHPSNFRIEGFAERPSLPSVVEVGQRFGVPVVEDLGGGSLYTTIGQPPRRFDEPSIQESMQHGVTVCCFSGDKVLGGPQAGIIIGREAEVGVIARHPLMRALRVDKLVLAALEATLLEHLGGRATDNVPVARMIHHSVEELNDRALKILEHVNGCSRLTVTVQPGASAIGGGTAPGTNVESRLLEVSVDGLTPDALDTRLRAATPPVVGRIERDRLLLDLRTVAPQEDATLANILVALEGQP